tara:strand:+ start:539 stop:1198 length:660 start_codon:yes stop_codon:yes gene_type:complete
MKKKTAEKIYIFGTGGLSRVACSIINSNKNYTIAGFIEQKPKKVLNKKIYSLDFFLKNFKHLNVVLAIGENITRKKIYEKLKNKNFSFPNIISNYANIADGTKIGHGNIIMPNTFINTNSKIGNFCILNSSSLLEHDCNISSFVNISPAAVICGGCKLDEGVFIGANSTIIQYLKIEKWSVVGSASTVIKNIKKNTLNLGSPSRKIKKIDMNYKVFKIS